MEATKSFDAPESKLHFLDYWRIIRVRKTVILAVFLLVAITTTVVTFILPPTWASTVRIQVQKDATDIQGLNSSGPLYTPFDPYWVQTEFEKIQSKMVLYPVITNLELSRKWGEKFKEGPLPTELTYSILKRRVDVSQSRNTSLIEIKVESDDKDEAALIANTIADYYKESRLSKWRDMSSKGLQQLEDEMAKHNLAISNVQARVDELKERLQISDVDAQFGASTTMDADTLRKMDSERITAQADFARIQGMLGSLTNYSRTELKRAIVTASPDQLLQRLLEDLLAQEQRFIEMTNSLGFNHPDVKGLREKLDLMNRQVDDRTEGIIIGLKAKIAGMRAHLEMLTAEVENVKTNDITQTILRRPYNQARRDLENLQYIREKLNVRIWQEKVDLAMPKSGIVEIIDQAEPGIRPVKPRKLLNILMGVVVGLSMGVGLAFFIEYLDTSVKTIDDVERALQAPVLGVIPQNVGHLLFEGPDSPHAEAYRVLRTNILFSLKDPKLNTITIVSAGAGEGKSTTIFNLATVFAQNGSRVLVVDSDLRRPSLHKILKVSNAMGLTNVLMKQNTLEEVIQTSTLPALDFLPSGKLPSSSMGVLSSAQMKELIRDLKRRYDYVFFDSPPIMGVSDASILASEVDSVLQVIQYRRYPQPMTIRAKQMIEKVGGNLLGIVLNNINMASDENYYYYSGYYYDYYSKNEESEPDKAPADKSRGKGEEVGIKPKY